MTSLFGLGAVSLMLGCYALEHRSPWFILGFAVSCALGSAYGFLQAWPFGLVEAIWALVALQRWRRRRSAGLVIDDPLPVVSPRLRRQLREW